MIRQVSHEEVRPGRAAQRRRTRAALLEAARGLLASGEPVSVHAAAERAGVSRATAYRYFSDPKVLAAEAGIDAEVRSYEEITAGAATPRAAARAIALYFLDHALAHEAAFRGFLARSLDASLDAPDGPPRRGARRVAMLERALADLPAERRRALVRGLAAATGAEAMISLLDVVRTDPAGARATVADTVDALLDRHLGREGQSALAPDHRNAQIR
jgi:AcrR family transcriptional regulator